MTEEAKEKALQELHRLEAMPPMSAKEQFRAPTSTGSSVYREAKV
jgi:hypothetical protein